MDAKPAPAMDPEQKRLRTVLYFVIRFPGLAVANHKWWAVTATNARMHTMTYSVEKAVSLVTVMLLVLSIDLVI